MPANLRVHVPSVIPDEPALPGYQGTLFGQDQTVREVITWHLCHLRRAYNVAAMLERRRILDLFCAWVGPRRGHADYASYGDWHHSRCQATDVIEFLETQARVRAFWTERRWIVTIQTPFNNAAQLGMIGRNPFRFAKARGLKRRGKDYTSTQFATLLRFATPVFRRVLTFLRLTGARPGELRNLEWTDVKMEIGAIILTEHKTVATTAEPEPRRISLTQPICKLLLWLKRHQPAGQYVFTNSYGRQWTTWALCKNIRSIRKKAGLPNDVKLYGCRHTYATAAILNAVDVALLAELLGHKSITTTRTYLHLAGKKQYLNDAAEKAIRSRPRD